MSIIKRQTDKVIDLPFEQGETYKTKMATGWTFTITSDPYVRKDGVVLKMANIFYGFYSNSPELVNCPISPERLIPKTTTIKIDIDVCESCNRPL